MNKPYILVVEDDVPVSNLITTTLKAHEYKFLTAKNGENAIMQASTHNPDIALVDLGFKLNYESSIYGQLPRVEEIPFDSSRKLMTTIHKNGSSYEDITKGAFDILLPKCTSLLINEKEIQ